MPSKRAGPAVSRSISTGNSSRPSCTSPISDPKAVSKTLIPLAASANVHAFSLSACGAWSVPITSIVPSATAATSASTSSPDRSGGFTFVSVSYAASPTASGTSPCNPYTHSSVIVRWCGVASALTATPRSFPRRTYSTAARVLTCGTCSLPPTSPASSTSRPTITDSPSAGRPASPSRVATTPSFM